ncbi:hypothetical protein A3C23_04685 [Candidatus Roizmanbacteria bacterium RIFCSPHIGHO2_02_FULL_37_13b]|uniref:Cohesin domain-containing protein n=1 Tax=Candidatus Roizmanbacteria bacterium RIFCSPLOWO2_02_FULL_36_11 TaxID=1802071 RepID=A0A1F7JHC5_9BACT|nr:MAG: hypothetical protein A3C23_04685 [Candidatus Roizmanbacteria bacterium RIFCSPHIGHO2_02_FULL_37_13b]OGK55004.1 MAG: hypothetical protein A3H78_00830 [Candidatus Roizmanbacteria bacterium RIFCSPLOWO2_02_FULL_36_11]
MKKNVLTIVFYLLIFVALSGFKNVFAFNLVSLDFNPSTIKLKENQEIMVDMTFSPNSQNLGISGFDVCFKYNPDHIQLVDVKTPVDLATKDTSKFSQINKKLDNVTGVSCLGFISILPDDQLARKVALNLKLKGLKSGSGQITVTRAQIVGNIPENLYKNNANPLNYQIQAEETGILMKIWAFLKSILPFLK